MSKVYEIRNSTSNAAANDVVGDGTTDMGKNVVKKEKTPICGATDYLSEIDDDTLYDSLGLNTVDQAFLRGYGVWKKKGDGSVNVYFESVDKFNVSVVIKSGGDELKESKVPANGNDTWTSTVEGLQDKTLYLDRWRPGLLGFPGTGSGSLLMWILRSMLAKHIRLVN
ncbi:hypothetical protein V7S43_001675 [Phytophthora oleae]|uniref:Uncharacterized protein n=1 Tax=Phytophthora oleae TaxID=2107226 RepID=A0ABD3G7K9_9STRA